MAEHSITPAVIYRDPTTMLGWLEKAFGFEPSLVISDADGNLGHAQMSFGNGAIMVGSEWSEDHKSPASIGHKCTQTVHVHIDDDIDAHCERARAAGAEIIAEPEDQFYGDRTYRARDPEGHIWTFGKTVNVLKPEEWDMPPGLKTTFVRE